MSFIGTLSTLFNNSNASIQGANAAQQQYWTNLSNYMGGLNNAFATNLQALAHNYWMNNPQYLRELHDLQRQNEIAKLKMSISNMSNTNAQGSKVNSVLGQSGFNVPNSGVMPNGENGFNVPNNNANQTTNNPQVPSQKSNDVSTIVYDPNNPPQTTVIQNNGPMKAPNNPGAEQYFNQSPVFQEQAKQTQPIQPQRLTIQAPKLNITAKDFATRRPTVQAQAPATTNQVTTPISNPTLPQQAPTPKLPQQQTTVAQTPTPTPKLPQQQTIVTQTPTQTPTPTPTPAPVVVTPTTPTQVSNAWDFFGNLGQMPVPGSLTFEQAIATTRDPVSVISLLNPKERSILRAVASSQYFGFKMPDDATPNMVAFVGSLNSQQLYEMMNKF